MRGLKWRITSGGVPVLRLHYTADLAKCESAWLDRATSGYPGGVKSPRWRKEMEIDYGALSGQRLFPQWEQWSKGPIVCEPFDPVGYILYGSYDHGWRHPAAYYVHGISPDGHIVTLWEFHAEFVPYTDIAALIKGENVTLGDGRSFSGNPFHGKEKWIVADPSIWADDQESSTNTMKSVASLFEREGLYFRAGTRGGDTTVAEWLLGHYWADPQNPGYRITTQCPKLIWELGQQRHREFSASVAANRSQPEELVDKDNDGWDALKYFLHEFPVSPKPRKPATIPATFSRWQKQNKASRRGEPMKTYRRDVVR